MKVDEGASWWLSLPIAETIATIFLPIYFDTVHTGSQRSTERQAIIALQIEIVEKRRFAVQEDCPAQAEINNEAKIPCCIA